MKKKKTMKIFGIDPGSDQSGVVEIGDHQVKTAEICLNDHILSRSFPGIVIIEDIKPYSVRLSQQTIDTCKFIGKLEYRFKETEITFISIPRWEVKKWVYDNFPVICDARIQKKIARKNKKLKDGKFRKPSFVYVDDRIIIAAMKEYWEIPTPKPGRKSLYGLTSHSWQALAVATFYTESNYICAAKI